MKISGFEFSPDFVWVKQRNTSRDHRLANIISGTGKDLRANATNAEITDANGITAFNSDGFSVGSSTGWNQSSGTYVSWCWDAGSSTVSNTNGSITSSVRVNQTAGFSIVTGTGSSSAAKTCGHGLNAEPHFIVVKLRVTAGNGYDQDWQVYHKDLGNTKGLKLNTTAAAETSSSIWNNTSPTNSVFSIGASSRYDGNFVAYCFTAVAGYSAFGSYTGNQSTDGPFVHLGFRPALIIFRNTGGSHIWGIYDSARDTYNVADEFLRANGGDAAGTAVGVDFLSNGFKVRGSQGFYNQSGATILYMAWAENPFQANGGLAR